MRQVSFDAVILKGPSRRMHSFLSMGKGRLSTCLSSHCEGVEGARSYSSMHSLSWH